MFVVSVFVLSQTAVGFLFICMAIVGHCNTPHADKNTMAETIKDSHDEEETSDKAIEEESVKSAENTELEDSYMRIVNPETAVASTLDPVDEDDAQQSDDAVANPIEPVVMDEDIQQRDVAMDTRRALQNI